MNWHNLELSNSICNANKGNSTNILIPWGFLNVVWLQEQHYQRHFGFIAESDPVDKKSCQFVFSCVSKPVFAETGGRVDICRPSAATGSIPPDIRLVLNGMVAVLPMT